MYSGQANGMLCSWLPNAERVCESGKQIDVGLETTALMFHFSLNIFYLRYITAKKD
jgi:hypothetical protein